MPSREKRKNEPPFPEIEYEFVSATKSADVVVFVGTSLRDPDIRSFAQECARRCPTMAVGPDIQFDDGIVPPEAAIVHDLAGHFLISSLPNMLAEQDFPRGGGVIFPWQRGEPVSILGQVAALTDAAASPEVKSSAIESLWEHEVSLPALYLRPLIASGEGQVARDVLALLPLSSDAKMLIDEARRLAVDSADAAFREDVELLGRMHES